jgi:hypothetical protein
MVAPLTIGAGWQVGPGWTIGPQGGGGGGIAGIDGAVGYDQMPGPVVAGLGIEDSTATVNNPVGFTINTPAHGTSPSTGTGVAVGNLSTSNQTFFSGYGTGTKTVLFGPGSTYSSAQVNLTSNSGSLVFYIDPTLTYPATFNYPFTFQ